MAGSRPRWCLQLPLSFLERNRMKGLRPMLCGMAARRSAEPCIQASRYPTSWAYAQSPGANCAAHAGLLGASQQPDRGHASTHTHTHRPHTHTHAPTQLALARATIMVDACDTHNCGCGDQSAKHLTPGVFVLRHSTAAGVPTPTATPTGPSSRACNSPPTHNNTRPPTLVDTLSTTLPAMLAPHHMHS